MSIQRDRLLSLIEYIQHTAKMRMKPICDIKSYKIFHEYEHDLTVLPGLRLNSTVADDEVWLAVERLRETKAPKIKDVFLALWVKPSNIPSLVPSLLGSVEAVRLLEVLKQISQCRKLPAGIAKSGSSPVGQAPSPVEGVGKFIDNETFELMVKTLEQDPSSLVPLKDLAIKLEIEAGFAMYLKNEWEPWAHQEVPRRQTISLYGKLFKLKQQLDGGISDAPIELVWGVGMALWKLDSLSICHPLITRAVELSLNEETMTIEIRPRSAAPVVELEPFSEAKCAGVAAVEKAGKEFYSRQENTFSPFDRVTFDGLVRSAVSLLDPKGVYWPTVVGPDTRSLPSRGDSLIVTDTWVLYARPRSANIFLQDLDRFKAQLEGLKCELSGVVSALVTEPSSEHSESSDIWYRGLSPISGNGNGNGKGKPSELYFPLPFNDEQVQIIKALDVNDGVVTQGPPGTGKTHTIANIICHNLALGKRVLVTSMKEHALTVLRDKLPEDIRHLAIGLLTSDHEGMQQFEHAISQIADRLQGLDKQRLAGDIRAKEQEIEKLHAQLALLDRQIAEWARKSLEPIVLDGEELSPVAAADEVLKNKEECEWLADPLGIASEFNPLFDDEDIVRIRQARRDLGEDLAYLSTNLPQLSEFPRFEAILALHRNLVSATHLKKAVESGQVPQLADQFKSTVENLFRLKEHADHLRAFLGKIDTESLVWAASVCKRKEKGDETELLEVFEMLGEELGKAEAKHRLFIARPVIGLEALEQNQEAVRAVANKAQGKSAFGLGGLFGKGEAKRLIEDVRIVGAIPESTTDWQYVHDCLALRKEMSGLVFRWNSLALYLGFQAYPDAAPENALHAAKHFVNYIKGRDILEIEKGVRVLADKVFPLWPCPNLTTPGALDELEGHLGHHMTRINLEQAWAEKEHIQNVLKSKGGKVVSDIRAFVDYVLGNPQHEDVSVQSSWKSLMDELSRILARVGQIETVKDVTSRIKASGAQRWAHLLMTQPATGPVDDLLPGNWKKAWKTRRLATYLEASSNYAELKKLSQKRRQSEKDLAKAYETVVSQKTWLTLAQKATPEVKAALEAFRIAIARIGKGTGKRAIRHRRVAQEAAMKAAWAVPCWIMPHYKVSESLPAQFGAFDLIVIDEASQSDLSALPAIFRAKKILVVGDEKQVSPEGVGLAEDLVLGLMARFLKNQVDLYRNLLTPEASIYGLFQTVFSGSKIALKEHFRCVGPIIEYSKRVFYQHDLRPLRLPKASERLDPPLVDVLVEDGFRQGDKINPAEARFIVDEIKAICGDPYMSKRTIGVVSLLGEKQAIRVLDMLERELEPEFLARHKIACGDARAFQGKERDIMFLSMVATKEDCSPLTRGEFGQRFNVAASRARDKMYLVRSVELDDLKESDQLRRGLISHFFSPYQQDVNRVEALRDLCESDFEREVYDILVERGYKVAPQVKVGNYRIDMVVEGHNDARLAIECDGDRYHGIDRWAEDMIRQRILERAGWNFWRCFASTFMLKRLDVLGDLFNTLKEHGIDPIGHEESAMQLFTEHRCYQAFKDTLECTITVAQEDISTTAS